MNAKYFRRVVDQENVLVYKVVGDHIEVRLIGDARHIISFQVKDNDILITENEYKRIIKITEHLEAQQSQPEPFEPKTKYTLFCDGIQVEGYSKRSREDLCTFLSQAESFTMLDERGLLVAMIRPEIAQKASYIFEEL